MVEQGSHAELLAMEDGVYSRLVKIQTQVTKDPNVDNLVHHSDSKESSGSKASDAQATESVNQSNAGGDSSSNSAIALLENPGSDSVGDGESDESKEEESTAPALRWLDPKLDQFQFEAGHLTLQRDGDESTSRVFLVRTFPAKHRDQYISVRTWNEGGDDDELGLMRSVEEWPEETQKLIRGALDRRYLLRNITKIHSLKLSFGFMEFDVETDAGRLQFTSRWTQSKALTFGENGKLLIDTNENRYVVSDVDALSPEDRDVFLQYVYW